MKRTPLVATLPCLALLLGAFPFLRAAQVQAQQVQVSKENRTISITASAEATQDADTAIVHVGFLLYGVDQQSAYATGSKASNAIAKALAGAGVPKDAIESENQSIAPVQAYGNEPWTPEERVQRKFQIQQSWTVKTSAKNAAQVLDAAIQAGANQSGQIDWTLADDDALQAKAAGLALSRARGIAQQMAQGLGSTLGPLVYASNQAQQIRPFDRLETFAKAANAPAAAGVQPLSLSSRKVTRSAVVEAVFAIQ